MPKITKKSQDPITSVAELESLTGEDIVTSDESSALSLSQVYHVAKAGNDANDGLSSTSPFLTIGAATAAVVAQVPATGNRFAIRILDAGIYSENVTMPSWTILSGPTATLVGNHTLVDDSCLHVSCLQAASGTAVIKSAGTASAILRVNKIELTGNATGVACTATGALDAHVSHVDVANGIAFGSIAAAQMFHVEALHVDISGTGICLVSALGGEITGKIDLIEDAGAGTAIQALGTSTLSLSCNCIDTNVAYDVAAGCTLNLFVTELTGTETNAGTANVTKAGAPPAHAIDDALHTVGGIAANFFPMSEGGVIASSAGKTAKAGILSATNRIDAGNKIFLYGDVAYAGDSGGSLIYSTDSADSLKLIHSSRTDGAGNVAVKIGAYHAGTVPQLNPIDMGYYDTVGTTWYPLLSLEGTGGVKLNQGENNQSAAFRSITELTSIDAAANTDTTMEIPQYAQVYGVSVRVVTAIAGTATFTVGTPSTAELFSGVGRTVASTATTTDPCTAGGLNYFNAATNVRITPNVVPSDALGEVRVTIHYVEVVPPSS